MTLDIGSAEWSRGYFDYDFSADPPAVYFPQQMPVTHAGVNPAGSYLIIHYEDAPQANKSCRYDYSSSANAYVVVPSSCDASMTTRTTLTYFEVYPHGTGDPVVDIDLRGVFSPYATPENTNPCVTRVCDPATGPLADAPLPVGTSCSGPNDVCRAPSTCNGAGTCNVGAPLTDGTSCSNGNACDGEERCSGGACVAGSALTPAAIDDRDPCTQDSCDPSRGIVNAPIPGCYASTGAPPLDGTASLPFGDATEFLYAGSSPIQSGVAAGAIDKARVAVVRGRVFDTDGTSPATGAIVSIVGHPEYGQTTVRSDGWYDLAVSGGSPFTIDVDQPGRLRVQRKVLTKAKRFVLADDVVLTAPYTSPDPFVVGAAAGQVVRGATTPAGEDADGQRRALLYFPPGTRPTNYAVADGTALDVQVTEYTRGADGPRRMPGELPPTSGYTYALEASLPMAQANGVQDVQFDKRISLFVTNFTAYPVGEKVPLGYYDRAKGAWLGEASGRVIRILTAPAGGQATIDTDGDNIADNALGLSADELTMLAAQYAPNAQLWRVTLQHFSAYDANWGFGPPPNAPAPPPIGGGPNDGPDDPCRRAGSIIGCESRTLQETIPIVGTPYSLHYQSERARGFQSTLTIRISDGAALPSSFLRAHVEVEALGRRFHYVREAPLVPNASMTWSWDGIDAYGRTVEQGLADVRVRVGYEYSGSPTYSTSSFGAVPGSLVAISGNRAARTVTLWREATTRVRRADAKPLGLGGWSISAQHQLVVDDSNTLRFGDGRRRTVDLLDYQVDTVAGGGTSGNYGEGGPATQANLYPLGDIVAAPDGTIYVVQEGNNAGGGRIRRIAPNGVITTIAGLPSVVARTDGMPALHARIWPKFMALGPDGALYFTEHQNSYTTHQVWKIEPGSSPTLRVVAGTGVAGAICPTPSSDPICFQGEGGPATGPNANLRFPGSLVVAPDGAVLFVDNSYRIRRVGPEGTITTYFNRTGPTYPSPSKLDFRDDGTLFATDGNNALMRIEPTGKWAYVTTTLSTGWCATASSFYGVVRASPDDSYLLSCYHNIIQRTPAGALLRIAGDATNSGFAGDGGPALRAKFAEAGPMLQASNGDILVVDGGSSRVRRLRTPGATNAGLNLRVLDGAEVYEFTPDGRHQRTLSALRGTPLSTFGYDSTSHQLTSITDEAGNITQISRSAGTITITAPFGQVTTLSLDANGYLASVTSPKTDEVTQLAHTASGLLTDLVDGNGNAHHFEYAPDGRLTKDVDATATSAGQRLAATRSDNAWTVSITSAAGRLTRHTIERAGALTPASPTLDRAIVERRHIVDPSGLETMIDKYVDGATSSARPGGVTSTVLDTKPDPRWGTLASFPSRVTTVVGSRTFTREETRTATLATPGDPFSVSAQTITTTVSASGMTPAVTTRAFTVGPPVRWTTTSPGLRQTRETLDNLERVTQFEVLGSSPVTLYPTQIHYDAAGRVDQVTQGSRVVTTSFDPVTGWIASTTAPEALGVTYAARDANGRPTSIVLPGARTLGVSYDLVGNVLSVTPPSKPAHAFVRTPTNLLASYAPPDLGFSPKDTDYAYDPDGLVLLEAHPGTPTTFTRDGYGRMKTVTDAVTRTYAYNAAGLVESIASDGVTLTNGYDGTLRKKQTVTGASPISHYVETPYDNFLRVSSMNIDGANAVTFTRDADGFITNAAGMTASWSTNRLLTSTTLGSLTETFTYNSYGERIGQSLTGAASGYTVTLTRDGAGRLQDKSETIGGVTHSFRYEYDSAARLAAVYEDGSPTAARTWTYDANGNRSGATYDDQDRLRVLGDFSFEYRENGELSKKIDTSTTPNAETLYSYDPQGNLRGVTRPAPLAAIAYVIDGENRRVGKKVGGALVQGFLYDGRRIIAELDGTGAVVSRFVYVTGGHSPDVMITSAGTFRLVKDHLGSPRLVVSTATGAVAQRLDYDEWGNVTSDTSPGFQPFGFAGGLWDRDVNLVRFGARDYDPTTGRWTTKDRSRFRGGLNLYGYCAGDPVNFVDVTGYDMSPSTLVAASGAAAGAALGAGAGAVAGGAFALGMGGMLLYCSITGSCGDAPLGDSGGGPGPGGGAPDSGDGPDTDGAPGSGGGGDSGGGPPVCQQPPDDDCKRRASNWDLKQHGVDAHAVKYDIFGKNANISRYDICKCDSGGLAVKRRGCRGPIIERL